MLDREGPRDGSAYTRLPVALGLERVDLLGFSLGGMVALEIALTDRRLYAKCWHRARERQKELCTWKIRN